MAGPGTNPWRAVDALLKVRAEFVRWVDHAVSVAESTALDARCRGRRDIAGDYKMEIGALEDARAVFLRIVDGELRATTTGGECTDPPRPAA